MLSERAGVLYKGGFLISLPTVSKTKRMITALQSVFKFEIKFVSSSKRSCHGWRALG